jgi:uncharacterized protein YgiM (DUF1202 family)
MDFERWPRAERLAAVTLIIGVAAFVSAFFLPEVRTAIGLKPHADVTNVAVQLSLAQPANNITQPAAQTTGKSTGEPLRQNSPVSASSSADTSSDVAPIAAPIARQRCAQAVINDPDGYTNVRSGPGTRYAVLVRILERQAFCVTSQEGNWWKVMTPSGLNGYIYHNRVRLLH